MPLHLNRVNLYPDRYPASDRYPFCLPVFQANPQIAFEASVTLFVGENGTGKSALLEAIAAACGIHIWKRTDGDWDPDNPYQHRIRGCVEPEWRDGRVPGSYFDSEVFHDFAVILDEWAANDPGQLRHFGGRSLVTLSHGQSMMSYFRGRYRIKGLYLMDEPETALSPRTQVELLGLLQEASGSGQAQFIIATHSPLLLSCPGATILDVNRMPIRPIAYTDTDHYRVYKEFLAAV